MDPAPRRHPARRARLAARGRRARPGARDPGRRPLPQGGRHRRGRHAVEPLPGGARLRGGADRPARQRRLRRPDPRRVLRAGGRGRRRRDRLARRAAVVHGRGRDDRGLVGRVRRAAGGVAQPAGAQGHRPDPRLRRPLRRRRPLLRRLRAGDRHAALVDLHGRLRRPAAGPRGRRRRLARALGRADRVDGAVGRDLARAPAPRRLLAPGLGLRALRRHHLPGVRDRRLVRRLPRHGAADARARPRARARADRAVGAHAARSPARPARRSASCRSWCGSSTPR